MDISSIQYIRLVSCVDYTYVATSLCQICVQLTWFMSFACADSLSVVLTVQRSLVQYGLQFCVVQSVVLCSTCVVCTVIFLYFFRSNYITFPFLILTACTYVGLVAVIVGTQIWFSNFLYLIAICTTCTDYETQDAHFSFCFLHSQLRIAILYMYVATCIDMYH